VPTVSFVPAAKNATGQASWTISVSGSGLPANAIFTVQAQVGSQSETWTGTTDSNGNLSMTVVAANVLLQSGIAAMAGGGGCSWTDVGSLWSCGYGNTTITLSVA
jgi:hypothetical protein